MRTSFPKKKKNHRMKKNGGEVIFAELLAKIFPEWKTSVHRAGHTQKIKQKRLKKSTLTHIIRKMQHTKDVKNNQRQMTDKEN